MTSSERMTSLVDHNVCIMA